MSDPQPDLISESRSVGRYVKWLFPDAQLFFERPVEGIHYDILIDLVQPRFDGFGTTATNVTLPFVVYYMPTNHADGIAAMEKFRTLLLKGVSKNVTVGSDVVVVRGYKNRLPFWIWSADPDDPPPAINEVAGFLRLSDSSARIEETDEPGRYIVIAEFTAKSYRVDWEYEGATVNDVIVQNEVP